MEQGREGITTDRKEVKVNAKMLRLLWRSLLLFLLQFALNLETHPEESDLKGKRFWPKPGGKSWPTGTFSTATRLLHVFLP